MNNELFDYHQFATTTLYNIKLLQVSILSTYLSTTTTTTTAHNKPSNFNRALHILTSIHLISFDNLKQRYQRIHAYFINDWCISFM